LESLSRRRPNRLFYVLLIVSSVIHFFILLHICGIYKSSALNFIELTLQNISQPPTRNIPRPPDQPQEIKELRVTQFVPCLKPISIEPVEKDLPDSLLEGIIMPDIPDVPSPDISDWSPDQSACDYKTTDSYLEMVRLRIERYKKYPHAARIRQIEGSVTVRFIIRPEGDIRSAEVVETSGNRALDGAALMAVKDAAPFPKAPAHIFKGEIPLELNIVFELT
jgi:periplasmic protein TonB